jgi:DNA invertase Pin-like site-specific DNA recombinase
MTEKKQVIGYLRVSTSDQNTDKFKNDILNFANTKDFGQVQWVEETVSGYKTKWVDRKIKEVVDSLKEDDVLITPELSRFGRSTIEVLEILKVLKDKNVNVYSVKEGLELNGSIQSKIMSTMLSLFAELEHDFMSRRTKEGLKAARAKGKLLGRPKGHGKSKLDPMREEIIALLSNGSTKRYVADRYKTTPANLQNWLKKNKIKIEMN